MAHAIVRPGLVCVLALAALLLNVASAVTCNATAAA